MSPLLHDVAYVIRKNLHDFVVTDSKMSQFVQTQTQVQFTLWTVFRDDIVREEPGMEVSVEVGLQKMIFYPIMGWTVNQAHRTCLLFKSGIYPHLGITYKSMINDAVMIRKVLLACTTNKMSGCGVHDFELCI